MCGGVEYFVDYWSSTEVTISFIIPGTFGGTANPPEIVWFLKNMLKLFQMV